jgi:cobalt-zinc-cadmium efflux system outer membrane protein
MKSLRRIAVPLALALAAAGARAQTPNLAEGGSPERVYTIDDALRLIKNDPRLQSAEEDVTIADARVTEAELRFLPELGLQASASKYNALYPFSLSEDFHNILAFPSSLQNIYSGRGYFNMPLYEGKRTLNTYRLAVSAQKQALANRESVRLDLTLQVKEAFYHLLLAQERASASDDHLLSVERAAKDGGLTPWEAVEAEAALAGARSRASETAHELEVSKLAFLKALNLELDTPFRVSGSLTTTPAKIDVEEGVVWAMELRPELQSQTYRSQMDAIGVNLALGRRYPTVFLAGDYELTSQEFPLNKNNWDVSLGVKIPLTYDLWSQIKEKRAEQRQGTLTRADLQDQVKLQVRQAAESLRYWQEEWPRREKQWRRIQELYDAASGKAGSALSRIRAQESLLELKLSYLSAVTEHLLARARLARAVGREIEP